MIEFEVDKSPLAGAFYSDAGSVDFILIAGFERLGRNLYNVLTTLEYLTEKGVVLRVDNLGLESMVDGKPN